MIGRKLAGRGAALILALAPLTMVAVAQTDEHSDVRSEAGREAGVKVKGVKLVDDPSIPGADALGTDTDSRLFVESFLRGLFLTDTGTLYDAYLHNQLRDALGRSDFLAQVKQMRQALGKLDRLAVRYLRDENDRYDGADGGWANYVLVTERDPNVNVRVDYRRGGDGLWRVFNYTVQSAQLERVDRTLDAAGKAGQRP
jgi:hypothetical protein